MILLKMVYYTYIVGLLVVTFMFKDILGEDDSKGLAAVEYVLDTVMGLMIYPIWGIKLLINVKFNDELSKRRRRLK